MATVLQILLLLNGITLKLCTGQAPLASHIGSVLTPPTESIPFEASWATADRHWVRLQSAEAGQGLDMMHPALLSTA